MNKELDNSKSNLVISNQKILTLTPSEHRKNVLDDLHDFVDSSPRVLEAESKTWGFQEDPNDFKGANGTLFFRLEEIRFTIVRAKLENGGLRCYMTLAWLTSTFGWTTQYGNNPAPVFSINVKNSAGGVLIPWTVGPVVFNCGMNKVPMAFTKDFDPQVYEIIAGGGLFNTSASVYKC